MRGPKNRISKVRHAFGQGSGTVGAAVHAMHSLKQGNAGIHVPTGNPDDELTEQLHFLLTNGA